MARNLTTTIALSLASAIGDSNTHAVNVTEVFSMADTKAVVNTFDVTTGATTISLADITRAFVYVKNIETSGTNTIKIIDHAGSIVLTILKKQEWAIFPYTPSTSAGTAILKAQAVGGTQALEYMIIEYA
tara:strand:+ start:187 stop:576 length:390 start_codon:yes stop_codon:yes gene_type:complete